MQCKENFHSKSLFSVFAFKSDFDLTIRNLQKGHCNEGKYHKSTGDKSDESSSSTKESSNGIILPETEEMLREFYAPFNEHLAILLNDEGFLWTADQIKEDKIMAEVALQSDPMEIILKNAEEKKKERYWRNLEHVHSYLIPLHGRR